MVEVLAVKVKKTGANKRFDEQISLPLIRHKSQTFYHIKKKNNE